MIRKFSVFFEKYNYDSLITFIVFSLTWLGFGNYMAVFVLLAFIFALFFKNKRLLLFNDKPILILALLFTFVSIISSLFSIDPLISTLLSALWFLIMFIPISYVKFSLNRESDFFIKWVLPAGMIIALIIVAYLGQKFLSFTFQHGFRLNRRYTFITLGKATTPDTLVMLTGIGYAFVRNLNLKANKWFGFIYILICGFGVALTFDRGGVASFFIISLLLLSLDYKRLILYLLIIGVGIYLSFHIKQLYGIRHFFDFIYSTKTQKALATSQQIDTFKTAWAIIKDHWLLGVGTNNFSKFTRQYGSGRWYAYAHNFILQFWAENGIFGLIFALSILGLTLKRWIYTLKNEKYKYYSLGVGASFIGMLIGNLSNSTIWILKIALPFWMLVGIINAFYLKIRDEENEYNLKK